MNYKVTVVAVNEVVEVEVNAKHCIFDHKNNLIFVNKLEQVTEPIAAFPGGRVVYVKRA